MTRFASDFLNASAAALALGLVAAPLTVGTASAAPVDAQIERFLDNSDDRTIGPRDLHQLRVTAALTQDKVDEFLDGTDDRTIGPRDEHMLRVTA